MRNFIREKKITCGKTYMEVDLFPYTKTQQEMNQSGKRSKKKKESEPKQKNLNDKNAKRYFVQKVNGNFGEGDYHISPSFKPKFKPKTKAEGDRIINNFIRRLSYAMKKIGMTLKWIIVTEYAQTEYGDVNTLHYHIVLNKGLTRDVIEDAWCTRKKKGQKKGESLGFVNTVRLQPDEHMLTAMATYLSKDPQGKKRWRSSQNLENPYSRSNDHKYSKREVEKLAKAPFDKEYWQKKYPGWEITSEDYGIIPVYNDQTGWSIYLKFRKIDTT